MQLWVRAGARDEGRTRRGSRTSSSTCSSRGRPSRGPGVIDETISGLGGEMNAATSQDWTYFHVVLPAGAPRHGARRPGRRGPARRVRPGRGRARAARGAGGDPPRRGHAERRSLARAGPRHFGEHAYGRPVLGSAESIAGMPRETIVDYFRRSYVPNNATVVVSGSMPVGPRASTPCGEVFGRWAPRPLPARPAPAARAALARRAGSEESKALHQTYLGLAWAGADSARSRRLRARPRDDRARAGPRVAAGPVGPRAARARVRDRRQLLPPARRGDDRGDRADVDGALPGDRGGGPRGGRAPVRGAGHRGGVRARA